MRRPFVIIKNVKVLSVSDILQRQIEQKLDDLASLNAMVFDYWLDAICDEDDELIPAKCTEEVLAEIEKDRDACYI